MALSKKVDSIAFKIKKDGGDKKDLPITYLTMYIIEWIIGERGVTSEWIKAIYSDYKRNNMDYYVDLEIGNEAENEVIETCCEWVRKRKECSHILREENQDFFHDYTAPKHITETASALFIEKKLGLSGITERDILHLCAWAYNKGKRVKR